MGVGAPRGDDNQDDAAGFFGVAPPDDDGAPPDDDRCVVWPENATALTLFLALSTQWRRAGMDGQPTGLDYAAIPPTAALMGVTTSATLFEDLRDMEQTALEVWQDMRDRETRR